MLKNINISNILFLDIETVSAYNSYESLPGTFQKLWDKKSKYIKTYENEEHSVTYKKAGIYAEFGKIICISVGCLQNNELRIKSFYGDNEQKLLEDFCHTLEKFANKKNARLCAHNGKEFDFPYIARRLLINSLPLPDIINTAGKKPWEVAHLDTLELWKFGDYKNYTSLQLLSLLFKIADPKDDIDGNDVGAVYWIDHDIERIVRYCQKDVVTIAQLLLRYLNRPLITEDKILFL